MLWMPGTTPSNLLEAEGLLIWSLEASAIPASAVPTSAVPLLAFSPQAFALSVAGSESAPPALSLQEEECAAAGARPAEASAVEERVGSGWARAGWVLDERFRDGYSASVQTGGRCAPVARSDDSSGDESRQADCSADSAGYSLALWANDSSPGGCWAPANSAPGQADDLFPGGCSADSYRDDCSAVTVPGDSAGWRVDDSAERDWPRQDDHLERADWPDGSPSGWWAA